VTIEACQFGRSRTAGDFQRSSSAMYALLTITVKWLRIEGVKVVTIARFGTRRWWLGRRGAGRVRSQEEMVRTGKAKRRRRALADHGVEEVSCEE
jgi:hypothetical protein